MIMHPSRPCIILIHCLLQLNRSEGVWTWKSQIWKNTDMWSSDFPKWTIQYSDNVQRSKTLRKYPHFSEISLVESLDPRPSLQIRKTTEYYWGNSKYPFAWHCPAHGVHLFVHFIQASMRRHPSQEKSGMALWIIIAFIVLLIIIVAITQSFT